jgi:hypothetical protein
MGSFFSKEGVRRTVISAKLNLIAMGLGPHMTEDELRELTEERDAARRRRQNDETV